MIYGLRKNGREHGTVLTRIVVVKFMLNSLGYTSDKNLSQISVLDPSGGYGAFILECIKVLSESSKKFDFNFSDAFHNLKVVELDTKKCIILKKNIKKLLFELRRLDEVSHPEKIVANEDFLLSEYGGYDVVIGNPPYVRHENIPSTKKNAYKGKFKTFRNRSDLYIPFFENGLKILNGNGALCYICSNRWLKNTYGKILREYITKYFQMPLIVNLEKTQPFSEEVLAYPAIILIKNQKTPLDIEFFECDSINELYNIEKYLLGQESIKLKSTHFQIPKPTNENWILHKDLIRLTKKIYQGIEEQGFKIGIGVATGRDKVFIGKNLVNQVEKSVLIPIVTTRDLRNGCIIWRKNYLINPYADEKGNLIDLEKYPKTKKYLISHKTELEKRHTAKKNPRFWYKTIDKIYTSNVKKPKLLLPDMALNKSIAYDYGNFYPHHNLYYITGKNSETLMVLGAFLMSNEVNRQLHQVSNLMNGGVARWQSQNLRKLRIPLIDSLSPEEKKSLATCFKLKNIKKINHIINTIFQRVETQDDYTKVLPRHLMENHNVEATLTNM